MIFQFLSSLQVSLSLGLHPQDDDGDDEEQGDDGEHDTEDRRHVQAVAATAAARCVCKYYMTVFYR